MPDLLDLCGAAVEAAEGGEHVEAFGEERSTTGGGASRRDRGAHVRRVARRRRPGDLGRSSRFAHAADPTVDEVREAVSRARENAAVACPTRSTRSRPPNRSSRSMACSPRPSRACRPKKVPIALGMERAATTMDPRVRKTESVVRRRGGRGRDRVHRGRAGRVPRHRLLGRGGHARRAGRRHADRLLLQDRSHGGGPRPRGRGRGGRRARGTDARRDQTGDGTRAGAARPVAASSFLGVLSDGLSAESVQKQRSLFAPLLGEPVAADVLTLVDDGGCSTGRVPPFDAEGVPTRRTELLSAAS